MRMPIVPIDRKRLRDLADFQGALAQFACERGAGGVIAAHTRGHLRPVELRTSTDKGLATGCDTELR